MHGILGIVMTHVSMALPHEPGAEKWSPTQRGGSASVSTPPYRIPHLSYLLAIKIFGLVTPESFQPLFPPLSASVFEQH